MSGDSAKVRPAWIHGREAREDERVRPIRFPLPPPDELLRGFPALQALWESSGCSAARFATELVAAPVAVQSLAPVVIEFAPDRDAWVQLLRARGAPLATQQRLLCALDFDALSAFWVGGGDDAKHALLQAWDNASRALSPAACRCNLMKSHKARHPARWRQP